MQEIIAQQQDTIFYDPRRCILDLSTHILMINLNQISCLQCTDGLSDMEKVCHTGEGSIG